MSTIRIGSLVAMLILFYTPALAKGPSGPPLEKTICHKYGTPAEKTLMLPYPAAMKHVDEHGDTKGPCEGTSSGCPCFTDLSQVGFTNQATCNNSETSPEIFEVSSSFLLAQAGETTCRLAIDGTEDLKPEISPEEGTACIEAINNLCVSLSQP